VLSAGAPPPTRVWWGPGAPPGSPAPAAGPEYARRLVAFFDGALLGSGGSR